MLWLGNPGLTTLSDPPTSSSVLLKPGLSFTAWAPGHFLYQHFLSQDGEEKGKEERMWTLEVRGASAAAGYRLSSHTSLPLLALPGSGVCSGNRALPQSSWSRWDCELAVLVLTRG